MARFVLTPAARADLSAIRAYIRRDSPQAAARVSAALRHAIENLAQSPGMGHLREDLAPQPVRFWPVYSYLIVYLGDVAPIRILRVLHGARDVGAILGDSEHPPEPA